MGGVGMTTEAAEGIRLQGLEKSFATPPRRSRPTGSCRPVTWRSAGTAGPRLGWLVVSVWTAAMAAALRRCAYRRDTARRVPVQHRGLTPLLQLSR